MLSPFRTFITVGLISLSSNCLAVNPAYVLLEGETLKQGRNIWLENCEGCHGYGIADAPIPMNPDEWRARLDKGLPLLYTHAINGFFGPEDTMMPPRGGNPKLTDDEVKAAVNYMTALAQHYIKSSGDKK